MVRCPVLLRPLRVPHYRNSAGNARFAVLLHHLLRPPLPPHLPAVLRIPVAGFPRPALVLESALRKRSLGGDRPALVPLLRRQPPSSYYAARSWARPPVEPVCRGAVLSGLAARRVVPAAGQVSGCVPVPHPAGFDHAADVGRKQP